MISLILEIVTYTQKRILSSQSSTTIIVKLLLLFKLPKKISN
jgi:hypothetical protein